MSRPGDLPDLLTHADRLLHAGTNRHGEETYYRVERGATERGIATIRADLAARLGVGLSPYQTRPHWENEYGELREDPATGRATDEPLPHPDLRGSDGFYYAYVGNLSRQGEEVPAYVRGDRQPRAVWLADQAVLARRRLAANILTRDLDMHSRPWFEARAGIEFTEVEGTGPTVDTATATADVPSGALPERIEAGIEADAMTNGEYIFVHTGELATHIYYLSYRRSDPWQTIKTVVEQAERYRTGPVEEHGRRGDTLDTVVAIHGGRGHEVRRLSPEDLPKDLVDGAGRVWLHVGDHEGPRYRLAGPVIGVDSPRLELEARRVELVRSLPERFNVARCYTRARVEAERGVASELAREFGPFEATSADPAEAAVAQAARRLREAQAYCERVRARGVKALKDRSFTDERRLERSLERLGLDGLRRKRTVPVTMTLDVEDGTADVEEIVRKVMLAMQEGGELPEGMVRQGVNVDRGRVQTTVV